ncbi:MAG: glycosyltransferase family 4 protein [Verrucomicrobium sp.]
MKSPFKRRVRNEPDSQKLDIFDLSAVVGRITKIDPDVLNWKESDAELDVAGATRMILGMLRERDLRRRFPRALAEGVEGGFFRWLTTAASRPKLSCIAVENVRQAFLSEPARRVMHVYLQLPTLHKSQPLAVTPAGGRHFVKWLLKQGREKYQLRNEEILWFLQQAGENPLLLLVTQYLIQPDWQQSHPCALTAAGCTDWLQWLAGEHCLQGLKPDAVLCVLRPADELRLLHLNRPALQLKKEPPSHSPASVQHLADITLTEVPRPLLKAWRGKLKEDLDAGLAQQPGVNIIGHFSYRSGLQRAACTMDEALRSAGYRTSRRDLPAGFRSDTLDRSSDLGLELFDTTISVIAPFDPLEKRYRQAGLTLRPGVHRIGVWYWELDQLPPEWIERASSMQELWAPSRFIADAMRPVMPVPVFEMPPAVRASPSGSLSKNLLPLPEGKFLFLFMFDMCSVMERKNPLGLIRAFEKAFGKGEKVALVIKVLRGAAFPDDFDRLKDAAHAAGVCLIDQALSEDETQSLLNACDAYISLHRSEGFGLTIAEAMLLGKPVIATNYSGNTDFMNPTNSLLVDCEIVPITNDLQFYPKGNHWAEPSIDDAAAKMRWVFEHQKEASAMAKRGHHDAVETFSLSRASGRMIQRLEQISKAQTR